MPKITINNKQYEVAEGLTILQACEMASIEIPRFCYHDRLSIAGNCRMCLVDVSPGPPKPQASCALPIAEGMHITTDSESVRKARRGVMEFLLINHPLDCPICDQGGECDLQDQALLYGFDRGRFEENKRAVTDKFMGPLISTVMTRCIHCTRCVRFASEIAGIEDIAMLGRGENIEITSLEKSLDSELSGNLIDLCPVGALTSKPFAFRARSWELNSAEGIDVMDGLGSNIRIDSFNGKVLRVLPRLHEDINEEWISDKARFACDGLERQRLDRAYARDKAGRLQRIGWAEALSLASTQLRTAKNRIAAIAGDHADLESLYALKHLLHARGSKAHEARQSGARFDPSLRCGYLFNTTLARAAEADALLLVGCNPREEAPVLNARLRGAWLRGQLRHVFAIGEPVDLTYPCNWLGNDPKHLEALQHKRNSVAQALSRAEKPMLILGAGALARRDGVEIWRLCGKIAESSGMIQESWNGFNMLHCTASGVGALEIGFSHSKIGVSSLLISMAKGEVDVAILLGADDFDLDTLAKCFTIYIGHHGDRAAERASLILPCAAYTEKSGMWINTEGRVQMSMAAVAPPGEARAEWQILRALAERVEATPPWHDLQGLRSHLWQEFPDLSVLDHPLSAQWKTLGEPKDISNDPFDCPMPNYYMTDPISRASATMAECTRARRDLRSAR